MKNKIKTIAEFQDYAIDSIVKDIKKKESDKNVSTYAIEILKQAKKYKSTSEFVDKINFLTKEGERLIKEHKPFNQLQKVVIQAHQLRWILELLNAAAGRPIKSHHVAFAYMKLMGIENIDELQVSGDMKEDLKELKQISEGKILPNGDF